MFIIVGDEDDQWKKMYASRNGKENQKCICGIDFDCIFIWFGLKKGNESIRKRHHCQQDHIGLEMRMKYVSNILIIKVIGCVICTATWKVTGII